jgi:hypothetical protein
MAVFPAVAYSSTITGVGKLLILAEGIFIFSNVYAFPLGAEIFLLYGSIVKTVPSSPYPSGDLPLIHRLPLYVYKQTPLSDVKTK